VLVSIPFRLVDVFTDRPLAGNQLCVVPDGAALSEEAMQAIAREMGFSETTFVTEARSSRYSMRIFTPGSELPFAGHPSLGTAFVLVSEGMVRSPVTQSVAGGEFVIEVDVENRFARMKQGEPVTTPQSVEKPEVARCLGLAVEDLHPTFPMPVVSTGLPYLIVPALSEEAVARAAPDPRLLHQTLESAGASGCYLFAIAGDEPSGPEAKARMFMPGIGPAEDAATGSAAGPLGAYLADQGVIGPPCRLTIRQGAEIARPSTLLVDVESPIEKDGRWGIFVAGGVATVGRGEFDLPV
jgi:trans-2,3-dihydro-3-hydroxyanthranilate isomerase